MINRQWPASFLIPMLFLGSSPLLGFVDGQNAQYVLGQSNFTSGTSACAQNRIGALGVRAGAGGATYDPSHNWLFLADTFNNRVLVWDLSGGISANGMNAAYVLGQLNFTSNSAATTQQGMSADHGTDYDAVHQRLFVADGGNNRVLIYDLSGGITNYMNAAYVLGQSTWATNTSALSQNGMNGPIGVQYDAVDQWLFVTDMVGSRVLVYDLSGTPSITNGMNAAYVLGQPDFISNNQATTQNGMTMPTGIDYDPTGRRLFVADTGFGGGRILVFDLSRGITGNGMNASYVLGQVSFTATAGATTQAGMELTSMRSNVNYDPSRQRLFVSDGGNNRVLEYDLGGGIANGMNAAHVLGQANFTSNAGATSQSGTQTTDGAFYDSSNQRLFVSDMINARILVFSESNLAGTQFCTTPQTICGTVTSENPAITLSNIPVHLLDNQGNLLSTQLTNNSGAYNFTGLTLNSTYFVMPVLGRNQSGIPLQYPVANLTTAGALANLSVRGWPGTLQLTGIPQGSSILISTAAYSGTNSPSLNPSSPTSGTFYSTAAGWNGSATVQVPGGTYLVTCWLAQPSGSAVTYNRSPAVNSKGPYLISPNQTISASCN